MIRFATVLGLDLVDTSPNPPSGQLAFYARNGRLHTKDSGGSEVAYATTAELPPRVIPYSVEGELEPIEGTVRLYNDSGQPWNIVAVRATVSEPPTGSSLIVDVNIDGETIFTDQSKRPTIPSGETTVKSTEMAVTTVDDGSYLTVDIDQVGSTTPGETLVVQITVV